jgi:hypothetical protein
MAKMDQNPGCDAHFDAIAGPENFDSTASTSAFSRGTF